MKKYLPYINFILILIIGGCAYLLYTKDRNTISVVKSNAQRERVLKGAAIVVDGDTIKINGNRIRLLSIDTPETKQKCFDKNNKEYFCGKMATNFLRKIAHGRVVSCFYKERDVYNRYLGYCYLGDLFLNLEMVRNGMAVIYGYKKAGKEFVAARNEAKRSRLGIWQGSFELPKVYRRRVRR